MKNGLIIGLYFVTLSAFSMNTDQDNFNTLETELTYAEQSYNMAVSNIKSKTHLTSSSYNDHLSEASEEYERQKEKIFQKHNIRFNHNSDKVSPEDFFGNNAYKDKGKLETFTYDN